VDLKHDWDEADAALNFYSQLYITASANENVILQNPKPLARSCRLKFNLMAMPTLCMPLEEGQVLSYPIEIQTKISFGP